MARPPDRTFSFDNDDESSLDLNAIGQVRPNSYYQPQDTAYRDYQVSPPPRSYNYSPTRDYHTSPPPTPPTHRSPFRDHPPLPPPTDLDYSQPEASAYTSRRLPRISTHSAAQQSRAIGHSTSNRTASTTTPGADNMGEAAAGGGIAGVALGVANHNERDSGVEALRGMPQERNMLGTDTPYIPPTPGSRGDPFATPAPSMRQTDPFEDSISRGSGAPSPGRMTPRYQPSDHSIPLQQYGPGTDYAAGRGSYSDNPYKRVSTAWDPRISRGEIDPNDIADDGDDGMMEPVSRKRSVLGMRTQSSSISGGAAGGAAAGGGILGTLGGFVGKSNASGPGNRDPSGQYGPVAKGAVGEGDGDIEKSEWLTKQTSGRKRLRWIVGTIIVLALIGAIVGGVIGGIKAKSDDSKNKDSGSTRGGGESASEDDGRGDLDKDSPEIRKLMGNPDFHKVFPGMAYLPYGAQYPECLKWPPSQNNVTRDLAVLSQLTNVIRLYGTDCNQTEMVLHSIDRLQLTDMKVWLGVWLGNNDTTNDRQLQAMNTIVTKSDTKPFAGVVIGNEVLYREDLTETELAKILGDVKKNFTAQNIDLPIATSDLGDKWTAALASQVDIIMSNIHPFFSGTTAEKAAGWTWDFWKNKDALIATPADPKKNIISEVGWPSGGGNHCGAATCTSSTQGSIAGIEEMNTFMDSWVCQSLANGTDYFWFEAYDQPWQKQFNKGDRNWEDKWGLMGIDRVLKDGLKIPDCGGKTIS